MGTKSVSSTLTPQSSVDGAVEAAGSKLESWFCPPKHPDNIRDILIGFLDKRVTILTPFDSVTGTLIAVKRDYAVLVDSTAHIVLIPINMIESVTLA